MPLLATFNTVSYKGWFNNFVNIFPNGWTQQTIITANDGILGDSFGISVSLNSVGNIIGIGQGNPGDGFTVGSAYIFTYNNQWTQQTKLLANDRANGDRFGTDLAINSNGNIIIIGAPQSNVTGNGKSYIFTSNNNVWTQQAKLIASDGANNDNFGYSVAINSVGNIVVVGAYLDSYSNLTNVGAAYVFTSNNNVWTQQAKLIANDAYNADQFGFSVAINSTGNVVVIGAIDANGIPGPGAPLPVGAAYVFTSNNNVWTQQAKLIANDSVTGDEVGYSVAINSIGNIVAVGANLGSYGPNLSNTGAAYVFTSNNNVWTQQAKLLPNNTLQNNESYGSSIDINDAGNVILIGARNSPPIFTGSAYVFSYENNVWIQQTKVYPTLNDNENQGYAVSLNSNGNIAAVTAPGYDAQFFEQGGTYIYFNNN